MKRMQGEKFRGQRKEEFSEAEHRPNEMGEGEWRNVRRLPNRKIKQKKKAPQRRRAGRQASPDLRR